MFDRIEADRAQMQCIPGRERDTQLRAVPAAVDRAGVRGSTAEPHRRTAARVGSAAGEDDGKLRPEAFTRQGRTTTEGAGGRQLPRSPGELASVRESWRGQEPLAVRPGP